MGFTISVAQVLMTLSALAYVEDNAPTKHTPPPVLSVVAAALDAELSKKHYATQNQWAVSWGPIQYNPTRNLAFIAHKKGTNTYAIVLRGTVGSFVSFKEDIPTSKVAFGYGLPAKAKVSREFNHAFKGILATSDPTTGTLLSDYLASTALKSGTMNLYVTGHSQGAGLASMMTAWEHNQRPSWVGKNHAITNYTFAAPSSGNPAFANWINDNTQSYMVRNPLDIVPHGYASPNQVISQGIPSRVPLGWSVVVKVAAAISFATGPWAQPNTQMVLPKVPMDGKYLDQVDGQHNHNSYLYLLNAPQTDVGDASPLMKP